MGETSLYIEARDMFVEALKRHLVGPQTDNEILEEHPLERYHMGYLYPKSDTAPVEEDIRDENFVESDIDEPPDDDFLSPNRVRHLRAVGMTFQLIPGAEITIEVHWARYYSISSAKTRSFWQREAYKASFDVPIENHIGQTTLSQDGIDIRVLTRPTGEWITTTVSIINRGQWDHDPSRKYTEGAYQVHLEVNDWHRTGIFAPRIHRNSTHDNEYWCDEIRYRHVRSYAIGHGCAVNWDTEDNTVYRIFTEWVPTVEVPRASAKVLESEEILTIAQLGDLTRQDENLAGLERIAAAYHNWTQNLAVSTSAISRELPGTGREILQAIDSIIEDNREVHRRLVTGIDFLRHYPQAMKAFALANQAMALSMKKRDHTREPRWRTFQLAFILITIPSSLDRAHVERNVFDLIWFPTGGGKTEAYLGLAATVIFYRRLQQQQGLAVLTRYTLRLLTVQQFERTSRMICAAELIRRMEPDLQKGPMILSGLFVGRHLTPNSLKEAREILKDSNSEGTTTTLPLVTCPWCQTPLNVKEQTARAYLLTPCANGQCEFKDELPIRVVDEDIYQVPPDMIVATVDKLARMPWEPRMATLFDTGPDLIIQDELHLIGDALGSLMGLYETAIDGLCLMKDVQPKLIGSTATTRRTENQVDILFKREFRQFPAGGLDVRDAFFYQEDEENPGRLYVGVHAVGRSMAHTLERVSGVLLHEATKITEPRVRDQYWTLAIYFKALRELGGALVLMQDSVPRYMESIVCEEETPRSVQVEELTSHVPSKTIPQIFSRLMQPITELQDAEQLSGGEPVDVILATNMISVGIDVDRLGMMVVDGQPHSVSEYIQATSRVGRRSEAAGVVITLYNWVRPRDRSIYEQFKPFHQAMNRFVEPASATPFSLRARERALHAVLFTLARLGVEELQPPDSAHRILEPTVESAVRRLINLIIERVAHIDPIERDATQCHLEEILRKWKTIAEDYGALKWTKNPYSVDPAIIYPMESGEADVIGWTTLQSMRDVSPPTSVKILSYRDLQRGETHD